MITIDNTVIVTLLKSKHPKTFLSIEEELKEVMQTKKMLSNNTLNNFFDEYCSYKCIDKNTFNWLGNAHVRREMVSMMLLAFSPERIHGIYSKKVKRGFIKELSMLTKVSQQVYSNDINTVCDFFKIYNDFRFKTLKTFENITKK